MAARGQAAEAAALFESVLTTGVQDASAWNALAHTLAVLGELDRSESAFTRAIEIDPHFVDAWFGRGHQQIRLGKLSAAEDSFRVVAYPQRCDNNELSDSQKTLQAYAFHALGQIFAQTGRLSDSVEAYDQWYRLADPKLTAVSGQREAIDRGIPPIFLVGMQKSATEYIRSVLLAVTGAPLVYPDVGTTPRNRLIPSAARIVALGGCVVRAHLEATRETLMTLEESGITRLAVHLRDPRAATLSFAHHIARIDRAEFESFTRYHDPPLPQEYQTLSFERQLEWAIENYYPGAAAFALSWFSAIRGMEQKLTLHVTTYEQFVAKPAQYFDELLSFFGVSTATLQGSLDALRPESGRNYRLGDPTEWTRVFSRSQQAWMRERLYGELCAHFDWPI